MAISCQQDDEVLINQTPSPLEPEIPQADYLVNYTNTTQLKDDAFVTARINDINQASLSNNATFGIVNAANYGFSIDTDLVQHISTAHLDSYTFTVIRDSPPEEDILENYVLTKYADQSYKQWLITYHKDDAFESGYNIAEASIEIITDPNLITFSTRNDCFPTITYEEESCESTRCIGSQQHTYEEAIRKGCAYLGKPGGPVLNCTQGGWVEDSSDCNKGGSSGRRGNYNDDSDGYNDYDDYNNNSSGGGGGTGSNNTNNNTNNTTNNNTNDQQEEGCRLNLDTQQFECPTPVVPFENEDGINRECAKINDFLNAGNAVSNTFKQQLIDLQNSNNIDVEFEKSISAFENVQALVQDQGTNGNAKVRILATPSENYLAFVHTHPNDSKGTYSVFSYDDLEAISLVLNNNKLDTGTFVAFLITKKGDKLTRYALTINNKQKFQEFFYFKNDTNFDFFASTQQQRDRRNNSFITSEKLKDKFYDGITLTSTPPLITNTNTDSEQVLELFLDFINEADMGVTLFEADAAFDNFTRVRKKNNGSIERKPCNN